MQHNSKHSQRGAVALNILIVLVLLVIGVLGYFLTRQRAATPGRTFGLDAPSATRPTPTINVMNGEFNDGLGTPTEFAEFELDEFGAGTARRDVFDRDIDGDGHTDRITRTRVENGTDHFYYEYKIERNIGGAMTNITPSGMRTVEGAQCSLAKIRFEFKPRFRIIKISRPWFDTWTTPTAAVRTEYALSDGGLVETDQSPVATVCDVVGLF